MVLTGTGNQECASSSNQSQGWLCPSKKWGGLVEQCSYRSLRRGNIWNQEPERRRKLLLHKKQIQKLEQETKGTGMTLVPLKVYIKDGYAKLLLGLAKGKHDYDKRESIKRREQNRDIARVMKAVNQR